jgi:hypothetical protein
MSARDLRELAQKVQQKLDIEALAEKVQRQLRRRLVVEHERRGEHDGPGSIGQVTRSVARSPGPGKPGGSLEKLTIKYEKGGKRQFTGEIAALFNPNEFTIAYNVQWEAQRAQRQGYLSISTAIVTARHPDSGSLLRHL